MRSLLASVLLLSTAVLCAPPALAADDPAVEPPPTPAAPAPVQARGAAAPPGATPERVAPPPPIAPMGPSPGALVAYNSRRLSVRSQDKYLSGGYTTYSRTVYPFGPYIGIGSTYAVYEPVSTVRTWSVYQGSQRLTVPSYLEVIGLTDDAKLLRRRIQARKVGSSVLIGTAVAGLVTALVGGSSYYFARNDREAFAGAGLAIAGGVTAGFSFAGSWGLAVDARRLRWDFPGMFDGGIQEQVGRHNDGLRSSLGLRPGDVRSIDGGPGLK